jgi:hypothetical protein
MRPKCSTGCRPNTSSEETKLRFTAAVTGAGSPVVMVFSDVDELTKGTVGST